MLLLCAPPTAYKAAHGLVGLLRFRCSIYALENTTLAHLFIAEADSFKRAQIKNTPEPDSGYSISSLATLEFPASPSSEFMGFSMNSSDLH